MADSVHGGYEELKYLGFVEATGSLAKTCVVRVYAIAKEWSGSWRPRIHEIECKVTEALSPLCNLIKGNEHHILLFIDRKLDVFVCTVRKHAPHLLKGCLDKSVDVAKKVPDYIIEVSAEIHRVGFIEASKGCFNKAEPIVEEYLHFAWKQFLKLPFSLTVVHIVTPPALCAGDKVNKLLCTLKDHHFPLAGYLPLLPIKRIESIIKKEA
ncbi:hypothetical protein KP509_18G061400 [Ceratopteris richardii]|uniref:Uncharacterized protein n=1 Tax=Ceratopteris richardii TaxID=49495 RepID=A0A8T2STD7_CERRI|nr:hypothetical protein KP509_18G061400 [Ceratopteris richardii]